MEASTLLASRGNLARAEGVAAAARHTLDPIGARPLPINGPEPAPGPDSTSLTPTERTVVALVALVADGLSNVSIAERLMLTTHSQLAPAPRLHQTRPRLQVALAIAARHALSADQ